MAVSWTEEQRKVIRHREGDLLVSAAAGSGKTAVLVQHILSRLTDPEHPLDVDHMLVVTFTNAAAAEMRDRIGRALDAALEADPGNDALQRQRSLLLHAHISTIDSFCMWLVRNHFHQLDLDPDFRIADEGERRLLREDVLRELLEEKFQEGDAAFLQFADSYAGAKSDDNLKEMIFSLYDFAQSAPYPERWLADCAAAFGEGAASLDEMAFPGELLAGLREELASLMDLLDQAIREMCPYTVLDYEKTFLLDRRILERLANAGTFTDFARELSEVSFSRKPSKRGYQRTEIENQCDVLRDIVKDEVNAMKRRYVLGTPEQMLEAVQGTSGPMHVLLDFTQEFSARLAAAKRERNLAEFADVEHWALELLDGPTALARELSGYFEEIIVDEYQDSNLVQEKLLRALSRESVGQRNRFLVGDVKQSIYKFRMARPELFMEKYDRSRPEAGAEERRIDLSRNFRSRAEVLASANHLFRQLMTPGMGGAVYGPETELVPGASYPPPEHPGDYDTEVLLVDGDEEAADSREWEAKAVADRIRELVDPDTGLRLWDAAAGEYRPAHYRDIVILLRTMDGWAETFASLLTQEGIPAVAQQKKGYFDAPEVSLVLNYLKIIDNPRQDIPLMSVLTSPMGGFSEEEVAAAVAAEKQRTREPGEVRDLYAACAHAEDPKMAAFLSRLGGYRELAVHIPLHELIDRILDDTGYRLYLTALPGGETRRANVEMLREKALAFEASSYHGIFQFNRYIQQIRKYNVDEGEASVRSEQEDLVRIMSIHRSKGLEYPIVFVSGTGKSFNLQDARKTVILHEDLGLASDFIDTENHMKRPSLWKRAVSDRLSHDAKAEELRILYVAMTRAKEKLILTGVQKSTKSLEKKLALAESLPDTVFPEWVTASANSYLDWIRMGTARGAGGIVLREVTAVGMMEREIWRRALWRQRREEIERLDPGHVYDPAVRAFWESFRGFRYPHTAALTLRSTVSVSELKEREAPKALWASRARGEDSDAPGDAVGGAKRGTAYHVLMEHLSLSQAEETDAAAVSRRLQELTEAGILSAEAAGSVRVADIVKFCGGSLGRRAGRAAAQGLYHTEQPFVLGIPAARLALDCDEQDPILVRGIIDAWFEEAEGIILYDYKTDRIRAGEESVLVDRYEVQLRYYREALTRATGKPVIEGWLYSFCLGKAIRVY